MIWQICIWSIALFFWMVGGACVLALHNRIHFYVEFCFHGKFETLFFGFIWPFVVLGNILWALSRIIINTPAAYQWLVMHLTGGLTKRR